MGNYVVSEFEVEMRTPLPYTTSNCNLYHLQCLKDIPWTNCFKLITKINALINLFFVLSYNLVALVHYYA